MSRSIHKVPIVGYAKSEKNDKRFANRAFRKIAKAKLGQSAICEVEDAVLPTRIEEVSNDRRFAKSPRTFAPGLARPWTKK